MVDLIKYYQDLGCPVNMVDKATFDAIFEGYDNDHSGKLSRLELKRMVDEMVILPDGFVSYMQKNDEVKVK